MDWKDWGGRRIPGAARDELDGEPRETGCTRTQADGLPHRADDLLPEENDVVTTALKRLQPKEAYDRVFRLRRAFQVLAATN